ncbi:MAG: restriction endonuclease subunit M, partial [Zunongwangia sp.]|nr:restriction endonuclease subunit M [Zunongwangia sp.]
CASLAEIKENDYNLNIPRYVDTFEEEEPVDIEAVAEELKVLETEIQQTDSTIAEFCKELNIKTPF